MSDHVETRRVLVCDLCGWHVYSRSAKSAEELRASAARLDGWSVQDGKDACGDHAKHRELGVTGS